MQSANFVWPTTMKYSWMDLWRPQCSLKQVHQHEAVLVSAAAFVKVKLNIRFTQSILAEKVVDEAYDGTATFGGNHRLFNQVV